MNILKVLECKNSKRAMRAKRTNIAYNKCQKHALKTLRELKSNHTVLSVYTSLASVTIKEPNNYYK